MNFLNNTSLLSQVEVGMQVIDSNGEHIGEVLYVAAPAKRFDVPHPEPTESDDTHNPLDRAVTNARTFETELPNEVVEPLRQKGYIQVGSPAQTPSVSMYAAAPDIDRIDDHTVHLKLDKVKLTAL